MELPSLSSPHAPSAPLLKPFWGFPTTIQSRFRGCGGRTGWGTFVVQPKVLEGELFSCILARIYFTLSSHPHLIQPSTFLARSQFVFPGSWSTFSYMQIPSPARISCWLFPMCVSSWSKVIHKYVGEWEVKQSKNFWMIIVELIAVLLSKTSGR